MDSNNNNEKLNKIKNNWDQIIVNIRKEYDISDIIYNTWISPLTPYSYEQGVCIISIDSDKFFFPEYISKRYTEIFQVAIGSFLNEMVSVVFELKINLEKEDSGAVSDIIERRGRNPQDIRIEEACEQAGLNPKYTFESFVVGGNNNLAHASALAVAENPGKSYNPLFLYSGAGLGKTHLMHSIGRYIIDHSSNMKVLYVTSETFTNEVIASIRSGSDSRMNEIREKYRNVDVLLLDDVQFIIGKAQTQEEFFHTFNALHSAGKQIVLTSDKPPKEMSTLESRYVSRFEWGLIADIQPPDYETRMAILEKKAELANVELSQEICDYVASNIKSNIRELEGGFNKIVFYSRLNKTKITLEVAIDALKDIIAPHESLTMDKILSEVCAYYHISVDAVKSPSRNKEIVLPRHVFAYIAKDLTQTSFTTIGKKLNRDHTTILHSVEKVESLLDKDEGLQQDIEKLKKILTDH